MGPESDLLLFSVISTEYNSISWSDIEMVSCGPTPRCDGCGRVPACHVGLECSIIAYKNAGSYFISYCKT